MAITTHANTLASINEHYAKAMQESFEKDNSFLKSLKGDSSLSLMGEVNYKYGLGDMPSAKTTRIIGGAGSSTVTPDVADSDINPVTAQRYYYPVLEEAIPFEMSNSLIRRSDIEAPLMEFLSQTPEVVIDSVNDAVIARIKGVVANEQALETANSGTSVVNTQALASGTIEAANRISRDNVLGTLALLGERGNLSRFIAMHSNTYWALRVIEDADFFKDSDPQFLGGMTGAGGFTGEKYLGMNVIIDDKLSLTTGSHASNLVIMYADDAFSVNRTAPTMLHNPYDIFANGSGTQQTNAVWLHNHHISGYSWASAANTPSKVDPSNAELDDADKNFRVVAKQNLRFCALTVNTSSI